MDYLHVTVEDHSPPPLPPFPPRPAGGEGPARRRFPRRGRQVLRQPQHPHPPGHDRQRVELPSLPRLPDHARRTPDKHTSSPDHTRPGRTAKPNTSTTPRKKNEPTSGPSPPTRNTATPTHPHSTTTTTPETTPPPQANPQSPDCHQRNDRVHLDG